MKLFKKIFICFVFVTLLLTNYVFADTEELHTYSPVCLLMEAKTGKIIYEKNAYEKMYPASTTKIMTAILALENCELTDIATASYEAVFTVPVGYSNANIQVGEELTVNQLLNVLLIGSANEAANILAEHIAGSTSSFSDMMNAKAEEIGCKSTHFVNANGVHNENHYTTAYDLALMGRYAMQNEKFREIVKTTFYTLPSTNKFATNDRVFGTTNELLKKDESDRVDNYYYKYTTGIKTGYTEKAKNCIVASAQKDGVEYIVVIMGAETTENGLSARYLDCKNLFNYSFENYNIKSLHEAGSTLKKIRIAKASMSTKNLDVVVKDDISVLIKKDTDINSITPTVELNPDLKAPIDKNTVIGKITYNVDGREYSSDLVAGSDVAEPSGFSKFVNILFLLVILYLLFKILKNDKKKKRRKNKKSSRKTTKRTVDRNKNTSTGSKDNYMYW